MKAPSFPLTPALFHAAGTAFFGGCAVWLAREANQLPGYQRPVELVVAAASAVVAALSLRALVAHVAARQAVPLRSRAAAETYFEVLVAAAVLAVVGLRFSVVGGRPAMVTFCLGLAPWLLLMGFHVVPALLLTRDGFVDHLGRRTRFTDLEWFTVQTAPAIGDEPPRSLLKAGRGQRLRLQARLVGKDAEGVSQALSAAGLAPHRTRR
ncbi:hypothetical protein P2318_12835 [Myxococcaceae bacterium GXIMD 01537]